MPHTLNDLIRRNHAWSERIRAENPDFFAQLSQQQAPEYLWIGCSDSRVPANQIIDMAPGEVFVHRNVANVVVHTDLNCLSVVQYAVDVLQVKHILVVGHYGCGGVQAALTGMRLGLVDHWIRHVGDVAERHAHCLKAAGDTQARHDRLCELNALEQVINLSRTTVIRDAWARGQALALHGWVYGLNDGRVHDLGIDLDSQDTLAGRYQAALARICQDDPAP